MDKVEILFFNRNVEIVPVNAVLRGFIFHGELVLGRTAGKLTRANG